MNARILDSVDVTKNSYIQWTTVSPTSQNLELSMEYSLQAHRSTKVYLISYHIIS